MLHTRRRLVLPYVFFLLGSMVFVRSGYAAVLNSKHSNSVVQNVSGPRGGLGRPLAAAVERIWKAINQQNLPLAQHLMAQTQRNFHGWQPSPEILFAISEQSIWANINADRFSLANKEIQKFANLYKRSTQTQEARSATLVMRKTLLDKELWEDAQKGATWEQLELRIRLDERSFPGYQAPTALRQLLLVDQAAAQVPILAREHRWDSIIAIRDHFPAAFAAPFTENRKLLAQAQAESGHLLEASRYYYRSIAQAKDYTAAQAELHSAADFLPSYVVNILYEEACRRYVPQHELLARWHAQFLIGAAAKMHASGDNWLAWQAVEQHLATIKSMRKPADARLLAAILGAIHRPDASLRWWAMAAKWSQQDSDWSTVAAVAEGDGKRRESALALAHLEPDTNQAKALFVWYYQQEAIAAYNDEDYASCLHYLQMSANLAPLSRSLKRMQAWSAFHLHDNADAERMFAELYNEEKDPADAKGLVLSAYTNHSLGQVYELARDHSGPLVRLLPMPEMATVSGGIDEVPWRLTSAGRITVPAARSTYIGIGASAMLRGGPGQDSNHLTEIAPGVMAQWGIDWDLAAFGRVSGSFLHGNSASFPSTFNLSSGDVLDVHGVGGHSRWRLPSVLVGVDSKLPRAWWQIGLGWTSPSSIGGASFQGLAQYRWNLDKRGSSFSMELLRDALRQSWIAENGVRGMLTVTGPTSGSLVNLPYQWGAVMRNQLALSYYRAGSKAPSWDYDASLHFNVMTGQNLRNNVGWTSYISAMKPIVHQGSWWAAVGPALYGEGYAHDENFTSPGYGDYYSPQWLVQPQMALVVSHWWGSRGRVSLAASLGYQWARTAAAPLIGSQQLTAALQQELASPSFTTGSYASADTGSLSGSLELLLSQRIATHWVLDGGASYMASPAFTQTEVGVAIRYIFRGRELPALTSARLVENLWRNQP